MTARDFCYWLNGHLEISKTKTLSPAAVKEIRRHLALVFQRVKPKKRGKDWREIEYCAPRDPNRKICNATLVPKLPRNWLKNRLKKLDAFEKRSRKSRLLVK